jgi:hypothetical protein
MLETSEQPLQRKPGVSVVILSLNEEANLPQALDSVSGIK